MPVKRKFEFEYLIFTLIYIGIFKLFKLKMQLNLSNLFLNLFYFKAFKYLSVDLFLHLCLLCSFVSTHAFCI